MHGIGCGILPVGWRRCGGSLFGAKGDTCQMQRCHRRGLQFQAADAHELADAQLCLDCQSCSLGLYLLWCRCFCVPYHFRQPK